MNLKTAFEPQGARGKPTLRSCLEKSTVLRNVIPGPSKMEPGIQIFGKQRCALRTTGFRPRAGMTMVDACPYDFLKQLPRSCYKKSHGAFPAGVGWIKARSAESTAFWRIHALVTAFEPQEKKSVTAVFGKFHGWFSPCSPWLIAFPRMKNRLSLDRVASSFRLPP